MTIVKVSSNNFYVGNTQPEKDARFLRTFNCHVNGIQEGHSGNIEAIRRAIGETHRVRFGATFEGKDVPIVHEKGLNVLSFKSKQISKRAEVKNIGMPRAASIIRFKVNGEVFCFINTHLNAAVQGPEGRPGRMTTKRVFEFTRSIIALEVIIRRAKKRGEHVILVGDLNFRNVPNGLNWFYSPNKLFERLNMNFKSERLDYIAWTKGLNLDSYRTVPVTKHGADHPWLFCIFSVKA